LRTSTVSSTKFWISRTKNRAVAIIQADLLGITENANVNKKTSFTRGIWAYSLVVVVSRSKNAANMNMLTNAATILMSPSVERIILTLIYNKRNIILYNLQCF